MTDGTISRIRQVLLARLEKKVVLSWAPALGIGANSVRDWVDGIVGEGIAVAIAQQRKWDPSKGDFLHWAFLKAQAVLRKEVRQESRFQKAQQNLRKYALPCEKEDSLEALREDLLEALEQLPFEHRQALVLFYLHGMEIEPLSELLGKSPKTVYGLLRRARKKTLKIWKGIGRDSTPSSEAERWYAGLEDTNRVLLKDRRKELKLREFVDILSGLSDLNPTKEKGDPNVSRTHSNGAPGTAAASDQTAL